ncbi:hypothetical protein CBL_20426 [Carabus blaptoides fortunei]
MARAAELVQHKCFKNWEGRATGMESDIIVDGFSTSIEMHGVKYTKLVGDEDSSLLRKLLESRPYGPDSRTLHETVCTQHGRQIQEEEKRWLDPECGRNYRLQAQTLNTDLMPRTQLKI